MSIRKGIQNIEDRNKSIERRKAMGYIPELRLYNDEDVAIIRLLTDEPLDVDFHFVVDESISRVPQYMYCSKGDNEDCELCAKDVGTMKRTFMFWVYVYKVLHAQQDKDGKWIATTSPSGKKTMFQEDVESVKLFRYSFGRGRDLWKEFSDVYEEFGTWMDRDYAFRRRGAARDPNTTYKLSALEKTSMKPDIAALIGKLPSLEAVAKGVATSIDLTGGQEKKEQKVESKAEDESESKPKAKLVSRVNKNATAKKEEPTIVVKLPDTEESEGDEDV